MTNGSLILILWAQWNGTENAFPLYRSAQGFCRSCMFTVAPFQCGHWSLLCQMITERLLIHCGSISWTFPLHLPWDNWCFLLHVLLASIGVTAHLWQQPSFPLTKMGGVIRKGRLLSGVKMERGEQSCTRKETSELWVGGMVSSREEGRWG